MIETEDSPHSQKATGHADADSTLSGRPTPLDSSSAHGVVEERSLAYWIGALVRCEHPKNGLCAATVVEPNGLRVRICWCGACGAMRVPDEAGADWIRSSLAFALWDGDAAPGFAREMGSLAEAAAGLVKAAASLSRRIEDRPDAPCAELLSSAQTLEHAGSAIERAARAATRGFRP